MGTGEMLLSIGAIILLGTIILTANRGIDDIQQTMLESGYDIDAISIAKSIIDQADDLPFDKNTQSAWINSLNGLTPPANLGEEVSTGDTMEEYDDFNGPPGQGYLIDSVTLQTGLVYRDSTRVHYVTRRLTDGAFIPSTSTATWTKELDVWVWLERLDTVAGTPDYGQHAQVDTVHMVNLFSYWY